MIRTILFASVFALASVGATLASDYTYSQNRSPSHEQTTRLDDAKIRTLLKEQGYEVLKIEQEKNELEAYVKKEGVRWELKLDPNSGQILEREKKY